MDNGGSGVPRKVARMNMDGTNPEILVSTDLQSVNYLAIDRGQQVLYWTQGSAQLASIS